MNTNTDQLFFIDTGENVDKKDHVRYDIVTENEPLQKNTSPSDRKEMARKPKAKKVISVLGYDEEEAELEHLVFGGKPDTLFKDEDDDNKSATSDNQHIYDFHIDKACILIIFYKLRDFEHCIVVW